MLSLFAGLLACGALLGGEKPVVGVFPTAETLPANHLKFYLHFPAPMAPGGVLEHLQLIDLTVNSRVEEPFRETELWDDAGQRLTLWLHPGRQKTGVNLNVDLGPILIEGHRYELRLLPGWRTEQGHDLGGAVLKSFTAGPRAAVQLQLDNWEVPPLAPAGSRLPFILRFPVPLDHALLQRCICVFKAEDGTVLVGTVHTGAGEKSWSFTPAEPWPSDARLELRVLSLLEDLAGNSLSRPFEVDLSAPSPAPVPAELRLPLRAQR